MKNTKLMVRLLVLALALCMMLAMFAACKKEDDDAAKTTVPQESTEPGVVTDIYGKQVDSLPQVNYGREFYILAVDSQKAHFYLAEDAYEGADNVKKAIYDRNAKVEERMGVSFQWIFEPGQASGEEMASFMQKVENDCKGDRQYEAVISYNLIPYPLANRGLCVNLNDTQYIDLTGPWWPSIFVERLLYKDQLYALVNSCGYGTLTNMTAIYFNNTLLKNKKIESPYTLVDQNNWTAATLKTLIKDTYEDYGEKDGKVGSDDLYGLATSTNARLTCWYVGFGGRLSDVDGKGDLQLTVGDEQMGTIVNTIVDLFSTKDSRVTDAKQYTMFYEQRAVFYLAPLTLSSNIVKKELEIDYGVAPIPKLTSTQSRYYTHVPNTHEAYFISVGAKDVDASSFFVECMASEAYRQINDVFFETNLKVRYAPDERLAAMYDLVRDSISFDFLYIYKNILTDDCDKAIRNCISAPETYNWSTEWGRIGTSVTTDFQKILDTYESRTGA